MFGSAGVGARAREGFSLREQCPVSQRWRQPCISLLLKMVVFSTLPASEKSGLVLSSQISRPARAGQKMRTTSFHRTNSGPMRSSK